MEGKFDENMDVRKEEIELKNRNEGSGGDRQPLPGNDPSLNPEEVIDVGVVNQGFQPVEAETTFTNGGRLTLAR